MLMLLKKGFCPVKYINIQERRKCLPLAYYDFQESKPQSHSKTEPF